MTYQEVKTMLDGAGISVTYDAWPEGEAPALPWIAYRYPESDYEYADGRKHADIQQLDIDLYTHHKDFALERTLEHVLDIAGFTYAKYESYIESERMFQITYETEVLIDED